MEARKYRSQLIQDIMDRTPNCHRVQVQTSMRVASNIDDGIKRLGITRAEFGRRVGVSGSLVRLWLYGDSNMTIATMSKIADALNISVTELVSSPKIPKTNPTHEPNHQFAG